MSQVKMYQDVGLYSEVLGASNYKQIELLIAKAKSCLRAAAGAIENQDVVSKCKSLSRANDIVCYLRDCLNLDVEGDIAHRLDGIYAHLEKQILLANLENNVEKLRECDAIIVNIQTWWEKVGEQLV